MKYFEVHKYWLVGEECVARVESDGEPCEGTTDNTGDITEVVLFYAVNEYSEGGEEIGSMKYYPITTTGDKNNETEVLEQIKSDYPAGEWQNNDW